MSTFIESMKEELGNVQGLEEFLAILEIPDTIFDQMFDEMKREIIKNYQSEDFRKSLIEIVESGEAEEVSTACKEFIRLMDSDEDNEIDISPNKIEFLRIVFQGLCDGLEEINTKPYIPVKISLELCHKEAKVPTYANIGDAGMDIYAVEDVTIESAKTALIKTGLKVAIPFGYELQVRPRSGMSLKTKIRVANAPGTIDCGYRNEVGIIVDNISDTPYEIKKGDRIAQFVLQKLPFAEFVIVDSVSEIGEDRKGGFGSTGK